MARLTRHDILKEDKFVLTVEKCREFFLARKQQILLSAGGVAVVVAVTLGISYYLASNRDMTRQELSQALNIFQAPVGNAPAEESGPVFKTSQEKYEKALTEFRKLVNRKDSSAAGKIAQYYAGLSLLELGRDAEALAQLEPLAKEKSDYGALAKQLMLSICEKSGNLAKATEWAQQIVADDQPAAPKSVNLMHLAQLYEQQKKTADAVKAYQQLIKEFPESPLVQKAEERIKLISK